MESSIKITMVRKSKRGFVDIIDVDPTVLLTPASGIEAYKGAKSEVKPKTGNPSIATTPFTEAELSDIETDDGVYVESSANASGFLYSAEVAHRFIFDLSAYCKLPIVLDKVTLRWDGCVPEGNGSLWLRRPIGWDEVVHTLPASDGSGWEAEYTTPSMVSTLTDKKLEWAVYASCTSDGSSVCYAKIRTDAIQIEVAYHITDLLNAPIIKPKVIGVSGYER